ncbi:hypothetical protein VPH35_103815 [Triticum aestivum]|uniref:uncharacterized protein n=1 Tax=Triticum aestivum TaxID=4565 RepID=UPI00162C1A47|nr:uncharacterized protein LOC123129511 [Triticum aestivum]
MAAEHDGAARGRRKKTVRSEVLGVYRLQRGKYRARIWDPSRRAMKNLGAFATAQEAARAYDAAAVGLHGAATALTYFRQHTAADGDGDAPLLHVDADAKADGGDAPVLRVSCVGADVGVVESRPGRDAAESAVERKAPLRPVARTVFRRGRRRPGGKCAARIRCPKGGARRYLGGFSTAEEAARAYAASAVKLRGAIGLKKARAAGEVGFKGQAGRKTQAAAAAKSKSRSRSSSLPAFRGVRQTGGGKKYSARIWDPARRAKLFLGAFDTAEEAAGAYDAEAVRMRGAKAKTNLKQQPTARKKAAAARTGAGTKFCGVHRKPSGKYAAQIRHVGESSRWLGLEDAARAYDAAAVKLHGVKAITNFKQPPMAAAVDDGGESPMDHNDVPELRGVTAKTNLNQPPMVAGSADGGEESRMDLADNDFPEQPALDLFSGTITADAQLEDVFADLPPLDLQQVDELLMDMDFANMMA